MWSHGKQPKGGHDPSRAASNQFNRGLWQREQQQLNERIAANERRLAQKAAAARLAEKAALLAADKAAEEATEEAAAKAARAAQTARFLELGMKYEAHKKDERYPELTPEEFAEAGRLLGESEAWEKLAEDSEGLSWRANAAAHLDILAFRQAIKDSSGTSGTTEAVVNPCASIVDAVFEAHALRMGL